MNKRPDYMKEEETVNAMSMTWIDSCYATFLRNETANNTVGDSYSGSQEAAIPLVMFDRCGDNCVDKIHKARAIRFPSSKIDTWWSKITPVKIEPVVTSINLSELGASNCVSMKTIESCHDTRIALHLKHFFDGKFDSFINKYLFFVKFKISSFTNMYLFPGNLTSAVKSRGENGVGPDQDWLEVGSLQEVQDALSNWTVISFLMNPSNFTCILVWRLLVKYRWCSMATKKKNFT